MFLESQPAILMTLCVTPGEGLGYVRNNAWCCTTQTTPQKPSPFPGVKSWFSPWCQARFSFGLGHKCWSFSLGTGKALLNCIPAGNTSSQQTTPPKVPAEQLGVLRLEGQGRAGWHPSGGRLRNAGRGISKSKKGSRKGGGSQQTAIKIHLFPKAALPTPRVSGASAEGDGRLREERDGPRKSIVTNEPCWKHHQKQRAGFAGRREQRSAGCLLFAHRGTLWF